MFEPSPDHEAKMAFKAERENARRSHRLFNFGAMGLAALLAYYGITADVADPLHLYQGLLMIFLAALPSLRWARRGGNQLPVFEVLLLTTANTYALPLLNGHSELRSYSPDTITFCGFAVLLFQIIAIATHAAFPARPGRGEFFTQEIMTRDMQRYLGYGLVLSTTYIFIHIFYPELIPYEINSILRAVFYGIGLVSTFIQARRWGQETLGPRERTAFVVLLSLQVIMQFSTLFLVSGISILVLALVGYVSGGRRFPIIPVLAFFTLIALLHNGKSAMRNVYWHIDGTHQQVQLEDLASFYGEWVQSGFNVKSASGEQALSKKLFERTSLFHILCLVASISPERQPFLEGETYAHILPQFIPSFFWPGKPPGHISTYTLSIYYGLQRAEDTRKTTIGFGMVAEAYANYGLVGIGVLAFLLGAFYKKVQAATAHSPLLSYPGLYLVILMAWSFQTEFTMSIWLSSMFQACVAVLGLPFIMRNFLN